MSVNKSLSLRFFILITFLVISFAGFSSFAKEAAPEKPLNNDAETYKMLQLFGDVFERVRSDYVDEVKDKDLIEYAISGMLSSLDPHSSYMNTDSFEDMKVQTRGSFGGLGIEVTMENSLVKVIAPIDDTPAARAGVKAADYITHLDNKPVVGLTLSEAVDKMRGKVGTPIDVTIRREGVNEPIKLRLIRDIIKIKSTRFSRYDDIGYIRVTTFNQQTGEGVIKALEELQKGEPALKGLVLDLRNNPGGLLDQAISVSDSFLDKGEIVSTRGRSPEDTKRDNSTPGDLANGLPLVVLINGGSASAAEIVAGALQDNRRGLVLGTKSFGKGSVQTIMSLPNDAALRLTTARYYTPSGRSIQAKGIEPDILVEQGKLEADKNSKDEFVAEADLRGALGSESGSKNKEDVKPDVTVTPEDSGTVVDDSKSKGKKVINLDHPDLGDDYQLARALDMARGIGLYGSQTPPKGTPTVDEALKKSAKTDTQEGSDAEEAKPTP